MGRLLLPDSQARRHDLRLREQPTVARFLELWAAKGLPEMGKPRRLREPSLFD
jgi:hypothetical protein